MNHNFANLIAAIVLSGMIIFGWQRFYEKPRAEERAAEYKRYSQQVKNISKQQAGASKVAPVMLTRKDAINAGAAGAAGASGAAGGAGRIEVESALLSGSISLKGFRFDDLTLREYRKELDENSSSVELFSPSNSEKAYFAEIGWWSAGKGVTCPDSSTVWIADSSKLSAGGVVNLHWTSPENVTFRVSVALNEDYLFTVTQSTDNNSGRPISTQHYGLINRIYEEKADRMVSVLHRGMIGAIGGELKESSYDNVKDSKKESFSLNNVEWLGITDKYWLAAFIPDKKEQYSANYNYAMKSGRDRYQADFMTTEKIIENGESFSLTHHLFAGAKKVDLLDKYEDQLGLELFDRAIDFGWFYVLTKPIFNAMNFFYSYVGNFGISIMIVTIIIKLMMFTLANKSYRSMKKMKNLQPDMERLKELYSEDKARLNQEVMALYKREKVNPISGCLPLLVQIPVFFSIYKVLNVTIEMRHAPFFGWIQDLSASDPTTIFNLFGLLPFTPPGFLMIGVWPIIMALSMFLQQRMSPAPTDPVQAQVMKFMPLMFLFMFSSFPAGLLIYWSWNNVLSIVQQTYINKLDKNGN